jgi:hypothetical protein
MPGTFVFLKEEFQIDGAWGGLELAAAVWQLRAGIGSGAARSQRRLSCAGGP